MRSNFRARALLRAARQRQAVLSSPAFTAFKSKQKQTHKRYGVRRIVSVSVPLFTNVLRRGSNRDGFPARRFLGSAVFVCATKSCSKVPSPLRVPPWLCAGH